MLNARIINYLDGVNYKNIRLVCHKWCLTADEYPQREKFCNHLWTLIRKFPNEDWNWEYITVNRNTTWNMIEKYPHKMRIKYILQNENAIAHYLENPLKWYEQIPILFMYMSENQIREIPKCNWKLFYISKNKKLNWNFFYRYKRQWDWYEIFQFIYLEQNTLDHILSKRDEIDVTEYLSINPYITWNFIETHPEIKWNWHFLSKNLNITWPTIISLIKMEKVPFHHWDWTELSFRKDTTWDLIQQYPHFSWDWNWISANPNITLEIVEANPTKEWNWIILSSHHNITIEQIIKNPQYPWDWDEISAYNHSITWLSVSLHDTAIWNWANLSFNTFGKVSIFTPSETSKN